jgi:hypothetical protein
MRQTVFSTSVVKWSRCSPSKQEGEIKNISIFSTIKLIGLKVLNQQIRLLNLRVKLSNLCGPSND